MPDGLSGKIRSLSNMKEKTVSDEVEDTNGDYDKAETEIEEEKRMTGKSPAWEL